MLHLSVNDLDNFTDQVVLVTGKSQAASANLQKDADTTSVGGSSGVGLEFIKILLSKNVRGVVLADPAPPSPEIADAKQLTYVKTDVTDWDSIQVPFEKAAEVYGTLDMVFANAGVGEMEHLFVTEETGDGKLKAPKYKAMDIK
jgi:NAD(P)-dependent dehydrogenase (short-subunit alcohol dehydrogenase family)